MSLIRTITDSTTGLTILALAGTVTSDGSNVLTGTDTEFDVRLNRGQILIAGVKYTVDKVISPTKLYTVETVPAGADQIAYPAGVLAESLYNFTKLGTAALHAAADFAPAVHASRHAAGGIDAVTPAAIGATPDAAKVVQMTWEGTWAAPPLMPLVSQYVAPSGEGDGQADIQAVNSVGLNGFSYTEIDTVNGITTLSLDNVTFLNGSISLVTSKMQSFAAPELLYCSGGIDLSAALALTTLSLPKLVQIQGTFNTGSTSATLATLDLSNLERCLGQFQMTTSLVNLTALNLPKLTSVGGSMTITPNNLSTIDLSLLTTVIGSLTFSSIKVPTMSLPALDYVSGTLSLTLTLTCTTLNLSLLRKCTGGITIYSPGCATLSFPSLVDGGAISLYGLGITTISMPKLQTFTSINISTGSNGLTTMTIGEVGVTRVGSGAVTLYSSCSLNQASVDQVLGVLASLDGTKGTTVYASKTVSLSYAAYSPSFTGVKQTATAVAVRTPDTSHLRVTLASHGYVTGDMITLTGAIVSNTDAVFIVGAYTTSTFDLLSTASTAYSQTPAIRMAGRLATTSIVGQTPDATHARVTVPNHGYSEGDVVLIYMAVPVAFQGVYKIMNVTTNTFDIVNGTTGNATTQGWVSKDGYAFYQWLCSTSAAGFSINRGNSVSIKALT